MPLRLEVKRKLLARSDRVKSVDFHPTEPWLLVSLYNGTVQIWNHETQALVKTFEVSQVPVRSARFIARKSWVVCGSDDMLLRVVNYHTHEKVTAFEAHADYIRSVAVHPTQPLVLTSSDDMLIKLWDWERGWRNVMTFEGHTHYVMQVVFNPKDANTFASASLDRTVKVWSLGSPFANYTLEGHEKGVNCVDYYPSGDKPYLVSGADDRLVKIWDYQNKTCVQTLEGHTQNISVVAFHPELPVIVSGSEDGTVRIWHSNTYRLENTLNYGMERVWAIAVQRGSNDVVFGYDDGTICVKLGREDPAVSMDGAGKMIWARHNDIQQAMVKAGSDAAPLKDGERLALPTKDLGSCEVYPQTLQHSANGRFVVVCGDGEYIIYTALAWRNKAFGAALEFVWAQNSNDYAVREFTSSVRVYKNFGAAPETISASYSMEGIFGGLLLGVRSSTSLNFYDWDSYAVVRRVDVVARHVFWSESGLVAVCSDDAFYVLRFNRGAFHAALERRGRQGIGEEGVEEALEFLYEVGESVRTGCWVGDCFIYTNAVNRLNSTVGGQVQTIAHFDAPMYLLGYISRENRVFLTDKDLNVVSYAFPLAVIEYQTAVLRGDLAAAERLLPAVPTDQRNRVARFLEGQDLKELAFEVTADADHRFELALALHFVDAARDIAVAADAPDKWKLLGEYALAKWNFKLAQQCLERAHDLEGLLVFYHASGNAAGLQRLAVEAAAAKRTNLVFICHLLLGDVDKCLQLLGKSERLPEQALFARTYAPSAAAAAVDAWKRQLSAKDRGRQASAIAAPADDEALFVDHAYGLVAEDALRRRRALGRLPAAEYLEHRDSAEWDLIGELRQRFPQGVPADVRSQLAVASVEVPASPSVSGESGDSVEADLDAAADAAYEEFNAAYGGGSVVSPGLGSGAMVGSGAEVAMSPKAVAPQVVLPEAVSPKAMSTKQPSVSDWSEPEAPSPKALSLKVTSPKVTSPKAPSPKALSPKAPSPKALSPKAPSPKALSPKALSPKATPFEAPLQNGAVDEDDWADAAAPIEPEPLVQTVSAPKVSAPEVGVPTWSAPATSAPAWSAPVESAPMESAPMESAPMESAPVESAPVETAPVETAAAELEFEEVHKSVPQDNFGFGNAAPAATDDVFGFGVAAPTQSAAANLAGPADAFGFSDAAAAPPANGAFGFGNAAAAPAAADDADDWLNDDWSQPAPAAAPAAPATTTSAPFGNDDDDDDLDKLLNA